MEASLKPIHIGDRVFDVESDRAAAPVALPSLGAAVRATVAERVRATGSIVLRERYMDGERKRDVR